MSEETKGDGNRGRMKEWKKEGITRERKERILKKGNCRVKSKLVNDGM
jgi:hypothetical protein